MNIKDEGHHQQLHTDNSEALEENEKVAYVIHTPMCDNGLLLHILDRNQDKIKCGIDDYFYTCIGEWR